MNTVIGCDSDSSQRPAKGCCVTLVDVLHGVMDHDGALRCAASEGGGVRDPSTRTAQDCCTGEGA